jgi:predicted nuclease of predicted toxin-antitoxin system
LQNGAIFEKAHAEKRTILTFDLDFGEIVAFSGGRSVSVIIFRLHNTRTPNVINHLKKVLEESGRILERGAVVLVEDGLHRVRHLPIGA